MSRTALFVTLVLLAGTALGTAVPGTGAASPAPATDDGWLFYGGAYWTYWYGDFVNQGLGIKFTPTAYPVRLDSVSFRFQNAVGTWPWGLRIYDDDGTGGLPGTLIDSATYNGVTVANNWNSYNVSARNVRVTSGSFYVFIFYKTMVGGQGYPFVGLSSGANPARNFYYNGTSFSSWTDAYSWLIRAYVRDVHDVGCTSILAPAGNYDSGASITPACSVYNYGGLSETYSVRMRIGSAYNNTATVTAHAGGQRAYVTFPTWTAVVRGSNAVACSTMLATDFNTANDLSTGSAAVMVRDVEMLSIIGPTGSMDSCAPVNPQARVRNNGTGSASFQVNFSIDSWADTQSVDLGAGAETTVTFDPWQPTRGTFSTACIASLAGDLVVGNDQQSGSVAVDVHDIAAAGITAPTGTMPPGSVTPTATLHNYGTIREACAIFFGINSSPPYAESLLLTDGLPVGVDTSVTFPALTPAPGSFTTTCFTALGTEQVPSNDTARGTFTVIPPGGGSGVWTGLTPMPTGAKPVGDGGWVAYEASNGMLYAARGNKQYDFFSYSPAESSWKGLSPIPAGLEAKTPGKGAIGCASGEGMLYALKGNNTQGFYSYDAAKDSWKQLSPIPLGATNKRVKGGSGLAYVTVNDSHFVYCLKGLKNEFWRYNVANDSWEALANAPAEKYNNGSWVALVETGTPPDKKLYMHEAKNHSFYAFDIASGTWGPALTGMPLIGRSGKSKKAKDGSSAVVSGNSIYAFKGGNTQEFWRHTISDSGAVWSELDTVPQVGVGSLKKKKVKNGAGITAVPGSDGPPTLYALKGNKTNEFWTYTPYFSLAVPRADRSGVMAEKVVGRPYGLSLSPNPLSNGHAVLRYSVPRTGPATLRILDVTGRTMVLSNMLATRTGSTGLDLRDLGAGVYLVKFSAEGFTTTHKLVVQR